MREPPPLDEAKRCDGSLVELRSLTIPANTVVQVNGFSNVFAGCNALDTTWFEAFTVVTVDQPSFSYAVTLFNDRPPLPPLNSAH